jgi:DNA-binding transcriptional LysR family regulator
MPLKKHWGLRLFDRSGTRTFLTRAGKVLLKYAERSARLLDKAKSLLAKIDGEISRDLRLGASTTIAQYSARVHSLFLHRCRDEQLHSATARRLL